MNVDQKMIIGESMSEQNFWTAYDRVKGTKETGQIPAPPFAAWPDLVFQEWSRECAQAQKPMASLQYFFVGEMIGTNTQKTVQYIVNRAPTLTVMNAPLSGDSLQSIGSRYTSILSYTPNDDNFFALLGTLRAAMVMDMLTFHAGDLATRDEQTGAVTKVKSIRKIQIACQAPLTFAAVAEETVSVARTIMLGGGKFTTPRIPMLFDMLITLEDIDPPENMVWLFFFSFPPQNPVFPFQSRTFLCFPLLR